METNNTTARIFPAVPDCETPAFWEKMENLLVLNAKIIAVSQSNAPTALKNLQKVRPVPYLSQDKDHLPYLSIVPVLCILRSVIAGCDSLLAYLWR